MTSLNKKLLDSNILSLNLLYILNISLPMLIFASFFFSSRYEESVQYMLITSFNMFLTFSFSGNFRQTLVADKNIRKCQDVIKKRFFFIPIVFLISFIISIYLLKIENISLILLSTTLVVLIWLNEISLVIIEIKKKFTFILLKLIFNSLYFFFLFLCFFFVDTIYLYYSIFFFITLFFLQNLELSNFKNFKTLKNIKYDLPINYVSSIFLNLSAFLFRYELNYFLDAKKASFILFCITVGSSLCTVTFNSLGPKDFNQTLKFSMQFKMLLMLYLFLCASVYFLINYNLIFSDYENSLKNALLISIFGGLIFTFSYIFRQNIISKENFRKKGFLIDVIFSFIVIVSVPLLYYINDNLIIYAYFFTSLSSLVLFYLFYNCAVKNKK